jgi:hypothetical protein
VQTEVRALAASVSHQQQPAFYDQIDGEVVFKAGPQAGTGAIKPIISDLERGKWIEGLRLFSGPEHKPFPPDMLLEERLIQGASAFRGARVSNLSPALARDLRVDPSTQGVVIVDAGSTTAADNGFQRGDIVVSVNNTNIANTGDLQRVTAQPSPVWAATIVRLGQQIFVKARAAYRPSP